MPSDHKDGGFPKSVEVTSPNLTFGDLLDRAGVSRNAVRLVRHQAPSERRVTPWDLWLTDIERLELYQSIQARPVFDSAEMIAAFVATPDGRTLFFGAYRVGERSICPPDLVDPISEQSVEGDYFYNLARDARLQGYSGRLVIEWGEGYRS